MRLIVPLQGVFQGRGGVLLGVLVPCTLVYALQLLRGLRHASSQRRRQQQQHQARKEPANSAASASSSLPARAMAVLEGGNSAYYLGWAEYQKNAYHPVKNPKGCIQLGLAESKLSLDLLQQWIEATPSALEFQLQEIAGYPDYAGLPSFRTALAGFMKETLGGGKIVFQPENMVITAGATAAIDILSFCLAEAGGAFLVPSPYYPGFSRDSRWRSDVELIPVPCFSSNNFNVTRAALNDSFDKAKKLGKNVRAVLLASPSNPVGNTLDAKTLMSVLAFVNENRMHLICDEIYAGSTFSDPQFVSIAKLVAPTDSNVHIIYGLSKDLGVPGFRIGVLYTRNSQVLSIATRLCRFCSVSTQTQCLLAAVLSDSQFMLEYVRENKRRLKQRRQWIVSRLKDDCGIQCAKGNAGFFCWVDLRHLLKEQSQDGESTLWSSLLYDVGLNLTPGAACLCSEPGWFRLCFTNHSEDVLSVALRRLKVFCKA